MGIKSTIKPKRLKKKKSPSPLGRVQYSLVWLFTLILQQSGNFKCFQIRLMGSPTSSSYHRSPRGIVFKSFEEETPLSNILVKKIGKEFIPRFAKYQLTFPEFGYFSSDYPQLIDLLKASLLKMAYGRPFISKWWFDTKKWTPYFRLPPLPHPVQKYGPPEQKNHWNIWTSLKYLFPLLGFILKAFCTV